MNILNKIERKFGKYAIPNLPLYLIICYAFGYIMNTFKPDWIYMVTLNPRAILHGQVWRLFSWILVPRDSLSLGGGFSLFYILLFLFFYYSIARNLEMAWGKFYFNVFIFLGIAFTVVGAFLLYAYFSIVNPPIVGAVNSQYGQLLQCPKIFGGNWFDLYLSLQFSTLYLNLSIFLAYALTYPNNRVLLFFIIPIKVKVLGFIYIILLGFEAMMSFLSGFDTGIISLVVIGSSLLNVFVFYRLLKNSRRPRFKEIKRQKEFKKKVKEAEQPASTIRHKCAVCGQTDVSNPNLTFRYCSKCNGNYEYCSEHLFTHKHIE